MKRIAIIGGGVAGVAAAHFLSRAVAPVHVELFEATHRLGGIVETIREGGFIVECGPDAWVTEKPWAHDLAHDLGLAGELIPSLDAGRKTYIRLDGQLQAMPDGMRMMVPADLNAVEASTLFSDAARQAFRDEIARAPELKAAAPATDESVATFVHRHFGPEVLTRIAAPLLSGVLGGDVATLSVRAVMPAFVAMERQFGSLILAVQSAAARPQRPIFTTLRTGLGTLVDRMVAQIPPSWLRLGAPVLRLERTPQGWLVRTATQASTFDAVLMAPPVHVARRLLHPIDPDAAALMHMEASTAVLVAFCFDAPFPIPPGFGFLVPPGQGSRLLACTFTDQKFDGRVPPGGRQIRAFFGGAAAERMLRCTNDEVASVARLELAHILGPLPDPILTVVRRWPRSLPQYAVGHLDRMDHLHAHIRVLDNLWLLGNGYRGVGIPDLIRDAHAAAAEVLA